MKNIIENIIKNTINVSNKNKGLLLSYLIILSIILYSYFLMVALNSDGYNPELFKNGYIYFGIFAFILSTVLIPLWKITDEQKYLKIVVDSLIFAIATVPLFFMIFIIGQINAVNFIFPLAIQVLWGVVILSLKDLLNQTKFSQTWQSFIIIIFQVTVIILSLLFLYFYYQYGQLVLTTIYDGDILLIFFTNPILVLAGFLQLQMGGATHIGYSPILLYFVVWSVVTILMWIISHVVNKKVTEE